jgi:hypothetical protein
MFVGFGGYWFTSRDMQGVVARIGKEKISLQTLMTHVELYSDHLREQGTELDDAKINQLKRVMLNNMMVDELLALKADELGILVTDEELSRDIRSTPAFTRGGQFDQETYFQTVRSRFKQSPQDYERDRRKAIKTMRLKSLFYRLSKVPPSELRAAYIAANKGSDKNFDKEKGIVASRLQQQGALSLVNHCLRQMQTQVEIQNLIDRVETGA